MMLVLALLPMEDRSSNTKIASFSKSIQLPFYCKGKRNSFEMCDWLYTACIILQVINKLG